MKKSALLIIALFSVISLLAQSNKKDSISHDKNAKALLDQLSAKTKSYQSISVKFDYTIENTQKKKTDKYVGEAYLKGDKYKLKLPGNEIFCDGKTVWTYLLDAKEVNITNQDPKDESILNPSKMFTIYEKGFKFRMKGEEKIRGEKCTLIELYPEKVKGKKYSMIKLFVNKVKMQIAAIRYIGKDGNNISIDISEFKANQKLEDNMFAFDKLKFPNVEENDLRN